MYIFKDPRAINFLFHGLVPEIWENYEIFYELK